MKTELFESKLGKDIYDSFSHLAAHETLNKDYQILIQDVGSDITIVAPHGGRIEPNTSAIAVKTAGDHYNYYCFEGIKPEKNQDLHITSHRFDEPRALSLVSRSEIIVTIHACAQKKQVIYTGGLFERLILHIQEHLTTSGIRVSRHQDRYPGMHRDNICNKGRLKKGVQLEISRGLRDEPEKITTVAKALENALQSFSP